MKIRTQFLAMSGTILLIPLLLLGLAWTFFLFNQASNPVPSYKELPPGFEDLMDSASWAKAREMLKSRPPQNQVFFFDDAFRLRLSSSRPPPGAETIAGLERLYPRKDILMMRPTGTRVWIASVQESRDPLQFVLVAAAVILLAILTTAVVFSIFLARNLTRSIVRLERVVRRLADGDLGSKVEDIRGSDEIYALGRSFDQLRFSLQEENARQSRFVMGVSHDLKSPLALIKGYVELLRDGPVSNPEARGSHFELILDKVDQLDGMIDQLIDYSKVDTGEWQETWTQLPLKDFLEDFCQGIAVDARLMHRTVETVLDLDDNLAVPCDARSIRRCFENLVHNALRYTSEGGTVRISAHRISGGVQIVVQDDGPGISPHDLPHVFEMFYKGTHSRRESGLGLGLAIVKTILDSHGWTIRAESDQGARFVINVPLSSENL